MPTPKPVPLELTDEERQVLTGWSRRRKTAQALAPRSRIVLECAAGHQRMERRPPKPFIWAKTADEILESLPGYCQRITTP